ncbi:MAG: L-2-amino-thiazoline-4-carboxylic acid hydrolase [Oscillospiraceae bacterium]|nr:L-2-amino-thiazoline-4-carboxylic acid hydrolase [Oscillospiraceae bacterium]
MSQNLTAEQNFRIYHFTETAKLIRAFRKNFGEETYAIVVKQRGEQAFDTWRKIAADNASNTIHDLIKLLWKPLQNEGFEYQVCETESGVKVNCTRCGLHDLARHCGITDEAFYMFCECDPYITEGFNPNIGLKRTKTLMQGHDFCDFLYYYKNLKGESEIC